ncbi:DUF58 domain-containing protein [Marinicellulosiphila megalodicopiae]|uniref:DUF58 domain-containing protein n=1 Tax=Marinicellulosiphila megalodicopiae TaxID=2724896 RepID=UPI003BB137DB
MQSMQPKLQYFAVISFLLFLITLNKWFLACAILFLCIPFIVNVFKFFTLKESNFKVSRDIINVTDVDSIVTVTLNITNNGSKLAWVEIEDLMDESLLYKNLDGNNSSNKWLYSFEENEKKTLNYEIKVSRGIHEFKGVNITTCDWLGINKHKKFINLTSSIQVNPRLDIQDRINIKSKLLHGFSGLINSKRAGVGVDFFGLREYNNQDSLKHIHWRASAKLQDGFLVKQNLITKNSTAMIDIDTRSKLLPKDDSIRLLEYSLKAARLISEVLINDGHKVGITAEQKVQNIILPAQCSNQQKLKINKLLSNISEHQGIGPKALVNMPNMFLKNYSTLIIISPLETNDTKYLLNLRRRGFNVICISLDYSRALKDNHNDICQLNSNHLQLKQSLLTSGLLQKGIIVINWDISQPFSHCIHQINLFGRLINETKYSL